MGSHRRARRHASKHGRDSLRPPPDRLTYVSRELRKLQVRSKSVIAARMVQEGMNGVYGTYGTKREMLGRLASAMLTGSRGEPRSLPSEAGAGDPLADQNGALKWLKYDPDSQSYFYIADDITGGFHLSFRDLTAAKRFLERVEYVKGEVHKLMRKTKPVITARLIQEGVPVELPGNKQGLLDFLALVLLRKPRPGEEGAGAPLPGEAGAGAPAPPASGVAAAELAVARMPAPKRKVHYDFHMGEFIIERFKQYIAPYKASGGEGMGWILGKAETLYTQPILQAWGLFIPLQQSTGTDGWQTSEDR